MPEKLLTTKEVAYLLRISEDEVKRLVDVGEIPAYKIGGKFLRFRKEQIEAIRDEIFEVEAAQRSGSSSAAAIVIAPRERFDYTFTERIGDFFYFNDFYIVSFIIIGILLYIILR